MKHENPREKVKLKSPEPCTTPNDDTHPTVFLIELLLEEILLSAVSCTTPTMPGTKSKQACNKSEKSTNKSDHTTPPDPKFAPISPKIQLLGTSREYSTKKNLYEVSSQKIMTNKSEKSPRNKKSPKKIQKKERKNKSEEKRKLKEKNLEKNSEKNIVMDIGLKKTTRSSEKSANKIVGEVGLETKKKKTF